MLINKKFNEFVKAYKEYDEYYKEYLEMYYNTENTTRFTYLETAYMWLNKRDELRDKNIKMYRKAKELKAV